MKAAGGKPMDEHSSNLQYLIREHMIENSPNKDEVKDLNNGMLMQGQHLHLRWNSQKGRIFIDVSFVVGLFCVSKYASRKGMISHGIRYLFSPIIFIFSYGDINVVANK